MFTVLNRLRGTWSWMAKVTGVIVALGFYLLTSDWVTSLALGVSYVAGESFGWGKWIGGVYGKNTGSPTISELNDLEGRNNGIHFLANYFFQESDNYYKYCFLALALRGALWFGIFFLPLLIGGYIDFPNYLVATALLGWAFPLSVRLGANTETEFSFKFMNGYWEQAEVWYGIAQDIIIFALIVNMV